MTKQTIPGPAEWPWIGSVGRVATDPLLFFMELAEKYGEVAQFHMVGNRVVLLSNPALIREVLVEREAEFPKAPRSIKILSPYLGNGLLTNNGRDHRKQRKLVQPAFHHKRIQAYSDIMVDYTQAMLATWRDDEVRSISDELMRLTLYIVAKSLVNEDASEMAKLADAIGHAVHEMQEIVDQDFESAWIPPLWLPIPSNRHRKAVRSALHTTIDTLIAKRIAGATNGQVEDRGDLLSMLLSAKDDEGRGLSQEQVRDELITILVAGHETTSNALTWTWYLLGRHPEVAAKLYEEVDEVLAGRKPGLADLPKLTYTTQIIKESMRLYPPAWMLNARYAVENTKLGDYEIARGTGLLMSPYVMHHLPRYFEDPYEFRPERFTPDFEELLPRFAYMPFGGGPRVCIGNSFAMMEATLILAMVSSHFALESLPGTVAEPNPQITLSIKDGLSMRLRARRVREGALPGMEAEAEFATG